MFRPTKNVIELIKLSCTRLKYSDNLANRISHKYIDTKKQKNIEDHETLKDLHSNYESEFGVDLLMLGTCLYMNGYDPVNHPIWSLGSVFFGVFAYDAYKKRNVLSDVILQRFIEDDQPKHHKRVEDDG